MSLVEQQRGAFAELGKGLEKSVKDVVPQVEKLQKASEENDLEFPDGLSLLTVKVDALLAYMHHMALLCAHRASGKSLGDATGEAYVRGLVSLRLMLEKMRPMETRIKYQIEKLMRAASTAEQAPAAAEGEEEIDPLAFRPNPAALAAAKPQAAEDEEEESGAYRPPKVAPVLFDPDARPSRKDRKSERQPSRNAALLADLSAGMSANPYETTTAGVGSGGALGTAGSSRARALKRMEEFEEDNYKRLSMSKKDAKRRRRDEQDVALGGLGLSAKGDRIGGGVEEEFGDLLRGSEREARRGSGAYDVLQQRSKRPSTLARAQSKGGARDGDVVGGSASSHKFKKAMRSQRKKSRA